MARIAGVNLPNQKPAWIALTAIYGIGRSVAKTILTQVKVEPGKRAQTLTDDELERIRTVIEQNQTVEGELRMQITQNIKRLKEIGTYRGNRHIRNLPVRGQRTKTNARTKRGKRVTVGSGRKTVTQKT
ncbi:30S ribosomal protein S13 [Candidatus Berkelbacteria bacterium]|nr:30S ribosomal protein S13 [Candidatus Berkelbacteria bacterium]